MDTIEECDRSEFVELAGLASKFYSSSSALKKFDINVFCSTWNNLYSIGAGVIFLLKRELDIIGVIGGIKYPDVNSGELIATEMFWFVDQEKRGNGIKLFKRFESWARDNKCKSIIMVHLIDSMPDKLKKLYTRYGYKPIEISYKKEL